MKTKLYYSIIIIGLFFGCDEVKAQAPSWVWAKSFGGSDWDGASSTAIDANGNVYMAGYFASASISFDTIVLTNSDSGQFKMFLAKFDAAGNVIWAKTCISSWTTNALSVAIDASGNIFITGIYDFYTIILGNDTLLNSGNSDIFYAKYDSNGNVIWAKSAGGDYYDYATSISIDAFGNGLITGSYSSQFMVFGNDTIIRTGYQSIFVYKFDTNGNKIWLRAEGGNQEDYASSITCDLSGNVYITGFSSSDSIVIGSYTWINSNPITNYDDAFLFKFDSNGNILWMKSANGINDDVSYVTKTDNSGNVFISGRFFSSAITFDAITLYNDSAPRSDAFIVKYDSSGNLIWAKRAGGTEDDLMWAMDIDGSGNVYGSGFYQSTSIVLGSDTLYGSGNVNDHNIFIVKYDSNGNALWAKSAGGAHSDIAYALSLDLNDKIYLSGYYRSLSIDFGSTTLTNTNNLGNIFLVKLDNITGIETLTTKNDFSIYPNPATNILTISLSNHIPANSLITINDMQGRVIKEENIAQSNSTIQVDVSALSQGVYLLRINGQVQRFVKM